ncbi:alpha/beta fold hydrolase [Nonomuraea terrae]|uniref:Alpha/beta fold hydrolase n=1 Tax=Nonomuraea terrae TaxID=2530383 RepID=A0A4R4XQW8_9ACTN|nr:alpha/beta fold hydrolase [Nonomuraea terrae]TDD33595.1 alpha/beta fold hydrolase [Nonomuraea terrae]
MTVSQKLARSDDVDPRADVSRPGRRRRRRLIASAVLLSVAGLLANAAAVGRQSADATGTSILPLDGGNVHVRQDGPRDAPALVLIHGFGGSTRWWDPLVPMLARSHRVVRIDLLGHGRSAKPAGRGYEIPEQGRRVGAALDRLGVKHAIVVGHSTGGSVATALAEQRRDLVTALALVNTGPRLDAFVSQGLGGRLMSAPVVGHLLWRFRTDSLIRRVMSTGFSRPGYEIPQQLVDDVHGTTYHAYTATSQAADDYLTQRPLPERLTAVGKPLLVIFGKEDRRWRSSSADDYRAVPGARVELLPGVGHSPMLEDPALTAAPLLTFTATHSPRADSTKE